MPLHFLKPAIKLISYFVQVLSDIQYTKLAIGTANCLIRGFFGVLYTDFSITYRKFAVNVVAGGGAGRRGAVLVPRVAARGAVVAARRGAAARRRGRGRARAGAARRGARPSRPLPVPGAQRRPHRPRRRRAAPRRSALVLFCAYPLLDLDLCSTNVASVNWLMSGLFFGE